MLTYKQKLINDITQMPDEQVKKLYLIFQMIMKEFKIDKDTNNNWKEDFKSISVWTNDNFDEIQKKFNQWKIEEF
ncbi:hypothetical protein H8E77_02895 [bacterium]|nr:hypothetical protein [bacterium]